MHPNNSIKVYTMTKLFEEIYKKISMKRIRRVLREPSSLMSFLGSLRASYLKSRMDMEEERRKMPKNLSRLLRTNKSEVLEYVYEIKNSSEFYERFDKKVDIIKNKNDYTGTTSRLDAQAIYVVCRIVEPDTVIETGCLYGSFDAHIALAMERNGNGVLHSIDLPAKNTNYGYLVPEGCKKRWNIHIGNSKDVLPKLANNTDSIDIFLHDSLHTVEHMRWEYENAFPHIKKGGILASHDVLNSNVFFDFARNHNMKSCRVRNVGFAIKKSKQNPM